MTADFGADRTRRRASEAAIDANGYVTRHAEVMRTSLRSRLRRGALDLLSMSANLSGRMAHSLARPRVHFVYLHYVFEDEVDAFRRGLESLARTHRLLSYSEAVERALNGPIDAPYLCFSFDDGLKSNVLAARILEEFGAKACFFVCPPQIGAAFEQAQRFCTGQLSLPATELMTWSDVEDLRAAGHAIGSHTQSHRTLADLSPAELEEEIGESRRILVERLGSVEHFAWPRGRFRHMTPEAVKTVFEAGYSSCASAERGCHVTPASGGRESLCLRREHWVARWPLPHLRYFLARSSERASASDNAWPPDWSAATSEE